MLFQRRVSSWGVKMGVKTKDTLAYLALALILAVKCVGHLFRQFLISKNIEEAS
jgi:hypothetical protein